MTFKQCGDRLVQRSAGSKTGDLKIILHGEKVATGMLEGIPSIYDIAMTMDDGEKRVKILESWEALSAVGRPVAAPPGIPEDRLAFCARSLRAGHERSGVRC